MVAQAEHMKQKGCYSEESKETGGFATGASKGDGVPFGTRLSLGKSSVLYLYEADRIRNLYRHGLRNKGISRKQHDLPRHKLLSLGKPMTDMIQCEALRAFCPAQTEMKMRGSIVLIVKRIIYKAISVMKIGSLAVGNEM